MVRLAPRAVDHAPLDIDAVNAALKPEKPVTPRAPHPRQPPAIAIEPASSERCRHNRPSNACGTCYLDALPRMERLVEWSKRPYKWRDRDEDEEAQS